MNLRFDSDMITYTGRTQTTGTGSRWFFPSTRADVRFKGTKVSFKCTNRNFWGIVCIGIVIDGRMCRVHLRDEYNMKETEYLAAENLEPDKVHTLTVFKMLASNHSFELNELICDGEFLPSDHKYDLSLEYYGDSVSAGEMTEADFFTGRSDPSSSDSVYDNSWFSYTWQCARLLNARFHNISQGGISVLDGTGYFHYPDYIGMESVFDKTCYFPEGNELRDGEKPCLTDWDFSKYTPDIVIFALGQNDAHRADDTTVDIYDEKLRRNWKDAYKKLISDVNGRYGGKPEIILLTTVLMHDPGWDDAIDEVTKELCAEGVKAHHFLFSRNGKATPGHPRRYEHSEMAGELAKYISSLHI
ncbi:MAG: electron transporter RnfD [Oscillospiraceae bacterium]|nr:electron transporter RnfD [Oscillospiraceae bacterium]